MKLSDFDYHLPKDRIAQTPIEPRDASKLLVLNRQTGEVEHSTYSKLADFLKPEDLLVRNNSKVIPARILGNKFSGGKIEILLDRMLESDQDSVTYQVLTKPGLKVDQEFFARSEDGQAEISGKCLKVGDDEFTRIVKFALPYPKFIEQLAQIGETPLPKYIHTDHPDRWQERYQTLYAKHPGSSASPTAGLHFTTAVENSLAEKNIEIAELTLHVGLGTFLPVKTEEIAKHHMHTENFELSPETAAQINEVKKSGRRVIVVGTTSARVLETVSDDHGLVTAQTGQTNIYIYPGYKFKSVDGLITNFHLPKSTLLMMVSAFVSEPNTSQKFESFDKSSVGEAYKLAIKNKYRFYSFGDGMVVL